MHIREADTPAQQVRMWRRRILLDGLRAKWPAHLKDPTLDASAPDSDAGDDVADFYLSAPVRADVADDYVHLCHALAEDEEVDGAVRACEDAITIADKYVEGPQAAARLRIAALVEERRLWTAHGQPVRAAAAEALARAERVWLTTPEASDAAHNYQELLSRSRQAMADKVAEENKETLADVNQGLQNSLQQLQQTMKTMQSNQGVASDSSAMTAMADTIAVVKLGTRVTETLEHDTVALRPGGALAPLRHVFNALPGVLHALDARDVARFVESDEGKRLMADFGTALVNLRRGEPIDHIMADLRTAADDARSAEQAAAPDAPAPAHPDSTAVSPLAPSPPSPPLPEDPGKALLKLEALHAKKLITDAEYKRMREEILRKVGL